MIAFLLAFAAQPLSSFPDVPLLGLFAKHPAFFAPLLKQLEASRKPELPASCPDSVAAIQLDVPAYLGTLVSDPKAVARVTALGLAEAKTLTVCFAKKQITATWQAKGFAAAFNPTPLDLDRVAGDYYWLLRASLHSNKLWEMANNYDRAQTGLRASRLDALLIAASAIIDSNAEPLLVTPLTGRVLLGETAKGHHFAELDASDTAGHAKLLQALNAPHVQFGRKQRPNEWGFFGGLTGLTGQGDVFIQLDAKQVRVADAVPALDRARTNKLGATQTAAVLGTLDLVRYRKLFERVGRPDDVRNFVRTHKLQSLVDLGKTPAPATLVQGDRVIYHVDKEGELIRFKAQF